MYLCETHLHTSEGSACASMSGAQQAESYKAAGYDAIFVTDHFFNGNTAVTEFDGWQDRVEKYCRGYENARAVGERIGLKVFFGLEYSYRGADLLVYGIDKEWLKSHDEIMSLSCEQFCGLVRAEGGYLVQAHPFRQASYLREIRLLINYADAVEVYNGGNRRQEYNDRAMWYARQFGMPITAGGDNHHSSDVKSGVMSEYPINTPQDYIELVRNGSPKLITPPLHAG